MSETAIVSSSSEVGRIRFFCILSEETTRYFHQLLSVSSMIEGTRYYFKKTIASETPPLNQRANTVRFSSVCNMEVILHSLRCVLFRKFHMPLRASLIAFF